VFAYFSLLHFCFPIVPVAANQGRAKIEGRLEMLEEIRDYPSQIKYGCRCSALREPVRICNFPLILLGPHKKVAAGHSTVMTAAITVLGNRRK
jgi:hypothetical protein